MTIQKKKKEKFIIGKSDIVNFPAFHLENVNVKIDSGAYSSTIHCSYIEEKDGELHVIFLDKNEQGYTGKVEKIRTYLTKKVRSSNGTTQNRFIIDGSIQLFHQEYNTKFTLSKRNLMRYPVLLGRKLLTNHFIIDTSLINQSYQYQKGEDK